METMNKEYNMNHSEKRANNTREKLLALREKVKENPPKTVLGKKLCRLKLQMLENKLEKQGLIVKAKNSSTIELDQEYGDYKHYAEHAMNELSNLKQEGHTIREQIREIENELEGLQKSTPEVLFSDDVKKLVKRKPKGYDTDREKESKKRLNAPKVNDNILRLTAKKQELEATLENVREKFYDEKERLEQSHLDYAQRKKEIKASEKENLALVTTNPIKNLFNEIKGIGTTIVEKFKELKEKVGTWYEARQQKADNALEETMSKSGDTRINFIEELRTDSTTEEQKAYIDSVKRKFDGIRANRQDKYNNNNER